MKDITFVKSDGWIVLYVDGKKIYSNHKINDTDLLSLLGIDYKRHYIASDKVKEYNWEGEFPDDLDEVEKKIQ